MRTRAKRILTALAAALLLDACGQKVTPRRADSPRLRSDGFLVILRSGGGIGLSQVRPGTDLRTIIPGSPDARTSEIVPAINGFVVRGVSTAAELSGQDVEAVVPNYVADITKPVPFTTALIARPAAAGQPLGIDQSAAFFFVSNAQWSLRTTSANRAWRSSGGGASVCIVDSGIDAGHGSFAGKSIRSTSFVPNSSAQTDSNGHGSHIAGTVTTNGVGGASVAPRASLLTAKVFDGDGNGGNAAAIINAVVWCTDNGADVINVSLGFNGGIPATPENRPFIKAFQSGLDYATSRGVLIVAAAGNEGLALPSPGRVFLPAEAVGVTSVAATGPSVSHAPFGSAAAWIAPDTSFDGMATYSNRGPAPSVDLSAPGGDLFDGWPVESLILSVCSRQFRSPDLTFPCADDRYFLLQGGTSQAAAHVAGAAAIIRGRLRASRRSPILRDRIESCLYRAVDNVGPANVFGRGRVNIYKAATQSC